MEIEISGYKVLIDDEDFERVGSHKWYIRRSDVPHDLYYFVANSPRINGRRRGVLVLHRFIMRCIPNDGNVVDHISGDTLDNRKRNLRICSVEENIHNQKLSKLNTTGYKGVCFDKSTKKWSVHIRKKGRRIYLGVCSSIDEAARLYDMAAIYYFGKFARTNFSANNYSDSEVKLVIERILNTITRGSSGYRNVILNKLTGKYKAYITHNKHRWWSSEYVMPEEAAKAYDKKALALLGDKAILNFPIETYKEQQNEQEATN